MSEQIKATIRRAIERFNNPATRSAYFEIYDTNCVIHGVGIEPGIEAIKQFYTAFWTAFPDVEIILGDIITEGDKMAARYVVKGTHKGNLMGIPPTGKSVNVSGMTMARFANGKCVERWAALDMLGIMQQIGVVPAPGQ